ncbi:uncharacterized protein LOC125177889 [Hyalella azteca]|uniref:Uncharacterized protein LOC125177889 n=1 Tax=Hyalella azteca TaxID=294128 RepID=A0A979FHK5_HYAAZ|nr:uncharacterized protein LOC125177889 [Hyalella azteca]
MYRLGSKNPRKDQQVQEKLSGAAPTMSVVRPLRTRQSGVPSPAHSPPLNTAQGDPSRLSPSRLSPSTRRGGATAPGPQGQRAKETGSITRDPAKARSRMDAFSFEGNCTAYKFRGKLCPCLKGEKVVYLTNASISNGSISTVPLSVAPYVNTTVNNVVFKQYQLQQQLLSVVSSKLMVPPERLSTVFNSAYLFPQEDGSYNGIMVYNLDVASCVTDTTCGLPVLFRITVPTYYFLNECGNTIDLDLTPSQLGWAVFSHPGFGCKPFPDGPTYNCTATFKSVISAKLFVYTGFLTGNDGSCDGYTAKVTYGPIGMTQQDSDFCIDKLNGGGNVITITLRGSATAKTFKAGFNFQLNG